MAVFLILCALCTAHALYYYPQLPERVAMHFGASGAPDAWSTRTEMLAIYLGTVIFTAGVFLGLGFGMKKLPDWAINIPGKDYWLSPDQRDKTLDIMLHWLLWLGSLTMVLLLDVFHQTIRVNLGKTAALEHPLLSTAVYLVLVIVWCIAVFRKFGRVNIISAQQHP